MIRDAEIEQLLRDYTTPILRVAGLSQQNIQVVIINDKSFNAFVMDAHRIFVNSGAITQATTPNQIIGVLAHETGHIVGGHLSKMRQELANAQTAAIVAMLLGVGAMVAGAKSGSVDTGNIGAAAISAPQSYLVHTLVAYQRAQEEQADRAGVRFLSASGQSAKGMYDTFKKFADEMMFSRAYIDPYLQNHPMPSERMAALAELVKTPYWDKKDPPELQFRHDMARAKLGGFFGACRYHHAALSLLGYQPAGALRACHCGVSFRRHTCRPRANRRPDRSNAQQSLFLRTEGPGIA